MCVPRKKNLPKR
jgi:DNA repair and recombination protein RAD52